MQFYKTLMMICSLIMTNSLKKFKHLMKVNDEIGNIKLLDFNFNLNLS